jgi:hypothetical protein
MAVRRYHSDGKDFDPWLRHFGLVVRLTFKRGDTSSLDPVWAIYGVLDLTREGRGDSAAYPNLQY